MTTKIIDKETFLTNLLYHPPFAREMKEFDWELYLAILRADLVDHLMSCESCSEKLKNIIHHTIELGKLKRYTKLKK